jgi:GNAT superfamily N-acetyltransferase
MWQWRWAVGDEPGGGVLIRPAREGEHDALTGISLRSVQQTWNYPQAFMEWEPESIDVVPEHILEMTTNVLEVDGRPVGFYVLNGDLPEIELSRMMIEPDRVSNGYGRLLWNHAVETATALGASVMTIDSDPHAEGFYRRMGAETVGEHEWSPPMMPDWHIKKMRFNLRD